MTDVQNPVDVVPAADAADPVTLTAEYVLPELKNIIVPPPDLRPIVEKTAAYVAKHGTAFEAVILSKQQNDRRFDFLHPDNAYHSFYKSKLVQLLLPPEEQARLAHLQDEQEAERQALAQLEAEQDAADAAADAGAPKPVVLSFHERLKLEIARSCQAHVIPTSAADLDPAYASVLPASYGVSGLDRDILRLTARYVASQGKAFLNGLLTREARNPSFDFMRASHPYYPFFQGTVQAYEQIMGGRLAGVEKRPEAVREEILGRIEYERIQEKLVGQKERDDENERVEMAMIDWHDFVVLRTVDFPDDEQMFLPAPFQTVDEINRALDAQDQLQADRDIEMDVEQDMAVEAEPAPEIVADAQVKDLAQAERNRAQTSAIQFQKCPSCGDLVRQNELSEHVRICLLDPRWKVQKQASMQKQRDSNLISGSDISRHLSELARRRQDIFTSGAAQAPETAAAAPPAESAPPPPEPEYPGGDHHHQQQHHLPPQQQMLPYPLPPYMPLPNQAMGGFPQPVQYGGYGGPPPPMMMPPPQQQPPYMPQNHHGGAGYPGAPPPPPPPQQQFNPHHHQMPPPPPPPPKRARQHEPAAAWASMHPGPVDVLVQLPNQADSESKLCGQLITLSVPITSTSLQLKKELGAQLGGLAPKKMKLQVADDGRWLKDAESLADLNLLPGVRLNFELKERGRKK